MAGGTVYRTDTVDEICDRAHEHGLHVHLDGARVFNAATYLKEDVARMTRNVDSVQFCLSKGLGAPVGSMIVGSRDLIERCRSIRKMLGGGMRQGGVLAAAGLVALEDGPKRLSGRSRQCRRSRSAAFARAGNLARSGKGSNEHRHLQRQAERVDVGRFSDPAVGAGRPGCSSRHVPRADGGSPRCRSPAD